MIKILMTRLNPRLAVGDNERVLRDEVTCFTFPRRRLVLTILNLIEAVFRDLRLKVNLPWSVITQVWQAQVQSKT